MIDKYNGRQTMPPRSPNVLIFFMDGVGLGGADAQVNPFVTATLPQLAALLGRDDWYRSDVGPFSSSRASFVPTDATLGLSGRPQSATGQAAILTGRNVPQLVGEHYGPKPNKAVAAIVQEGTLFHEVAQHGGRAALITPYPEGYFAAVASGKRLYSAVPLAVSSAGWPLFSVDELRDGRAVSPGFTGEAWRDMLGYDDIPILTLTEAGQQIARIATAYDLSFFEHWPSDRAGHRGTLAEAVVHLEMLDTVLGGLIEAWGEEDGLLIITSDHGNIEEKDHRQHTLNPVPTILVGRGHEQAAQRIHSLVDIAAVVRAALGYQTHEEDEL
jgi:hypothetical protein